MQCISAIIGNAITLSAVIMGAAGRDFHNFNVVYRNDPTSEVVTFTAAQIPGIADRRYPAALAGPRYPAGILISDECDLARLCKREAIDEVVFSYSDVEHVQVMHKASIALAAGADFSLLGPKRTMLDACVPVIAVSATEAEDGEPLGWTRRLEGAIPNEPSTQQGRGVEIIVCWRNAKTVARVRHSVGRVPAVDLIASEARRIAKILAP